MNLPLPPESRSLSDLARSLGGDSARFGDGAALWRGALSPKGPGGLVHSPRTGASASRLRWLSAVVRDRFLALWHRLMHLRRQPAAQVKTMAGPVARALANLSAANAAAVAVARIQLDREPGDLRGDGACLGVTSDGLARVLRAESGRSISARAIESSAPQSPGDAMALHRTVERLLVSEPDRMLWHEPWRTLRQRLGVSAPRRRVSGWRDAGTLEAIRWRHLLGTGDDRKSRNGSSRRHHRSPRSGVSGNLSPRIRSLLLESPLTCLSYTDVLAPLGLFSELGSNGGAATLADPVGGEDGFSSGWWVMRMAHTLVEVLLAPDSAWERRLATGCLQGMLHEKHLRRGAEQALEQLRTSASDPAAERIQRLDYCAAMLRDLPMVRSAVQRLLLFRILSHESVDRPAEDLPAPLSDWRGPSGGIPHAGHRPNAHSELEAAWLDRLTGVLTSRSATGLRDDPIGIRLAEGLRGILEPAEEPPANERRRLPLENLPCRRDQSVTVPTAYGPVVLTGRSPEKILASWHDLLSGAEPLSVGSEAFTVSGTGEPPSGRSR